jgi:hypothetical protein
MAMGGVGEAALLGAALGGGSAALTGGDPLKGALLGGLTGGIGGGASTLAANTAANAGTSALTAAGTEAATGAALNAAGTGAGANLATQGTNLATQMGGLGLNPASTGIGLSAPGAGAGLSTSSAGLPSMNYALGSGATAPGASSMYALGSPTLAPGGAGIASLPTTSAATAAAPQTFTEGMAKFASNPMASIKASPFTAGSAAIAGALGGREEPETPGDYDGPLKRFRFNPETYRPAMYAEGGITALAAGGYDRMVGEEPMYQALAKGGISDLGGYSDHARGGRMLKGPGDGMSDSIPASIAGKRPARLARDEFVVPADVVSGLGNGSSDAGAKHLYAMMDRVRKARTGTKKQGKEINARRFMPA